MPSLTTAQAAALLGVGAHRVRELIRKGRLPATRHGRDWLIAEENLPLVADRRPGRPPQKKANFTQQPQEEAGA